MRLLVIEDDQMIGESLVSVLRTEGYAVDWVQNGLEAQLTLADGVYDLVLLDLGLPHKGGLEVLDCYRGRAGTAPVLIITARDASSDRVLGLDTGADDYLVKPFDMDELLARIRALLRRSAGRAQSTISVGELSIDPATHEVTLAGKAVELSPREFELLHILASRSGEVMSREMLEDRLYGWDDAIGSNSVEVHIHSLRRKLGRELIRTIRGVGYKVVG